jgi:molybdopterin converting factor small subunit
MKVKIQYLGLVKIYTHKTEDHMDLEEDSPVSSLLDKIASEYGRQFTQDIYEPGTKDVKPMFTLMINGIVIGQLDGMKTKLKEGDNIVLMPLMTGG